MTLDQIAIKHGCDKSSIHHDYCRIYEPYLKPFWPENIRLVEIGYGGYDDPDKGGESMEMWKGYFPKFTATLVAIDIHHKNIKEGIFFVQSDQTDPRLAQNPFVIGADIIIDDGSHLNADIIEAFKNLWPVLNPGGLYCIEDVHSSYDPYYKDSHPVPGSGHTTMAFFSRLLHMVNVSFIDPLWVQLNGFDPYRDIEFIHFYKELIIIKKKAA